MLRIYGEGYDLTIMEEDSWLTEEDKKGSLVFDKLPPLEEEENFSYKLFLTKDKKLIWHSFERKEIIKND